MIGNFMICESGRQRGISVSFSQWMSWFWQALRRGVSLFAKRVLFAKGAFGDYWIYQGTHHDNIYKMCKGRNASKKISIFFFLFSKTLHSPLLGRDKKMHFHSGYLESGETFLSNFTLLGTLVARLFVLEMSVTCRIISFKYTFFIYFSCLGSYIHDIKIFIFSLRTD